jgi:16S rRNA (uracil1498-N3)-methyltransferase
MTRHRFFVSLPLQSGETIALDRQVSLHISSSLRLKKRHLITLFDGSGGEYEAMITQIDRKRVSARIGEFSSISRESPLQVHIAMALIRGDRMDYAIQKITEMGANQITPLITERSEVKLSSERTTRKLAHWRGIVASACEQCGRNQLPDINSPLPFSKLFEQVTSSGKFILHPGASTLNSRSGSPQSVTLVSGPEGGFTDSEIHLANDFGFQSIGFGPRVFRAETAPIATLSLLQYLWGDFGSEDPVDQGPGIL